MTATTGTVKFYNREKAFGFIEPEDGSKDVFFHKSGIAGDYMPQDGDKVSFEIRQDARGPAAINVESA